MNTSLSAYTSLETLLLFQSLKSYGVDSSVFGKISNLLKGNPTVRNSKQYDSGRLSPDALRELYAKLIRDEGRGGNGETSTVNNLTNGDTQDNPKKRKAPTPTLPTAQEAAQNSALIPRLVEKLYARYREDATSEIQDAERRYAELYRDIQAIERGEWDPKFAAHLSNGRQSVAVDGHRSIANPSQAQELRDALGRPPSAPGTPFAADGPARLLPHASPAQVADGRPTQANVAPPHGHANGRANENSSVKQPLQSRPDYSPAPGASTVAQPPSAGPRQDQPLQHSPVYSQPSPTVHQSPYPPPVHSSISASPQDQHAVPGNKSAASPMPPPPNLHFSSHLQRSPYSAPENQQHISQSSQSTPHPASTPSRSSLPHHANAPPPGSTRIGPQSTPNFYSQYPPPGAVQQQRPPPFNRSSTPGQGVPPGPSHAPRGGVILPPFQVTPQPPQQQPQNVAQTRPSPAVATPPPKQSRATPKPSTAPPHRQTSGHASKLPIPEVLRLLGTPQFKPTVQPLRPQLNIITPRSSTKWRPLPSQHALSARMPNQYRSPSVSPVNDLAPHPVFSLPGAKGPDLKARGSRQTKSKGTPSRTEEGADENSQSVRGGRRQPRRTRGASVTSSAVESSVRGRTRSHSIASHADTAHDDAKPAHYVKDEPSTPGVHDDVMSGIETSSQPTTRRTRNQGPPTTSSRPTTTSKRKRSARSPSSAPSSTAGPFATPIPIPPAPPNSGTTSTNQIIAPRYFSKMSAPLMNDITSHKHASLFSNPVKEKDAEGYHDIIRRPQDLKSIRAAIALGARAVASAAAAVEIPSASGGATSVGISATSSTATTAAGVASPGLSANAPGSNILLTPSEEVTPPRAIVNSAQLEKEIVRMFANAVMFNAGEDGVVEMAREMYEATQTAVTNWRSAERRGESEEGEKEGKGAEEEDTPGPVGKRRRL